MRTAFEDDNETRYRVSLDQNVKIQQDSWLHGRLQNNGSASSWHSNNIPAEEAMVELPFCLLEVKIAKGYEASGVDSWVWELVEQGYVQAEDKFSKYGAGCSLFYPEAKCVQGSPAPEFLEGTYGSQLRSEVKNYRTLFPRSPTSAAVQLAIKHAENFVVKTTKETGPHSLSEKGFAKLSLKPVTMLTSGESTATKLCALSRG
jgi:hypothetical protein